LRLAQSLQADTLCVTRRMPAAPAIAMRSAAAGPDTKRIEQPSITLQGLYDFESAAL